MHRHARPATALLLLLLVTLAAAPARARIVQPDEPAEKAERGGQQVPPGGQAGARPICSYPGPFGLPAFLTLSFALDACFGMRQAEVLAQIIAQNRISLEAERAARRADRALRRAAQARRAAAAQRERAR